MGGGASLAAAARLKSNIRGLAIWSFGIADFSNAQPQPPDAWAEEEGGQRVRMRFWNEAALDYVQLHQSLSMPVYAVMGTADELNSQETIDQFLGLAKPRDRFRLIEGLPHSSWPWSQGQEILRETRDFLTRCFNLQAVTA
jgi:pimeloyl-ACP methyl ester carboxylesterase